MQKTENIEEYKEDLKKSNLLRQIAFDKLKISQDPENTRHYGDILKKIFNLRIGVQVEVPCDKILNKFAIPIKKFIKLIKYNAYFNQNKRNWYENKRSGKKVLIPNIDDLIYALIIARSDFLKKCYYLKPNKKEFLNYIIAFLKKKDKSDPSLINVNICQISFGQTEIISAYQEKVKKNDEKYISTKCLDQDAPSKGSLINWLKLFSDKKTSVLKRVQEVPRGPVSYFLKKIAPLDSNEIINLIKDYRKCIQNREEKLIRDANIKFYKINID